MDGSRITTRAGVALAGLAGLALLAGCASPDAPPAGAPTTVAPVTVAPTAAAPPSAPPPSSAAPPAATASGREQPPDVVTGDPRCAPAQLTGRMEPGEPGAGQRAATLVVTNTSTNTCTLYGYGGAELYTASGVPIPTRLTRAPDPGPALVRLLPGASAKKDMRWTVVPTGDEPVGEPCQVPASQIRVIPPDETSPFFVIWDLGPVCDGGRIDDSAYYPS